MAPVDLRSTKSLEPQRVVVVGAGEQADIAYESAVNPATYAACLDFYAKLQEQLAPHGSRDWVDVQSFIWVAGSN